MKLAVPLFLALALLPSIAADRQSVEKLVAAARDSVVVISHFGRDGKEEGVGAGFPISSNLIATALHVIGESRRVSMRLASGKEFEADAIHAWDRKLDLAIVRVDTANLVPLELGDSDELKQGASVIAIGNPLGLEHSIVTGVVSAKRAFDAVEMIQLAIPIEPGNSGGPLLDREGQVQGILTMKSALSRNLGFAVSVNALKKLIERPNPVPMKQWLTIGSLNPRQWTPVMGARWRQKNGQVHVDGFGAGFGGRSICLSEIATPPRPFELGVSVRLDDESGAAGLIFGADGGDKHFGFYPTAGQLRLTDFQSSNVFSWNILKTTPSEHYRPGQWNHIKVRVEKNRLLCFINDELLIEADEIEIPDGKVGLAKFRDTRAAFKNFELSKKVSAPPPDQTQSVIRKAEELEREAARLRRMAAREHRGAIRDELVKVLDRPEEKIDLFHAALLLAKYDNPEVDIEFYRRELDAMAKELRKPSLEALIRHMFVDNGFHGSRTDYYNRANSYMNEVMDDREGLPISLAVLFIELARRAGLKDVAGIPAPGHFMVKSKDQLIDVFDGGKLISHAEAEALIGAPLLDRYLEPATKREIILRMIRNLQNAASPSEAARYDDLINALSPLNGERDKQRGLP
ncbi:MAG TPA: transglutaminase family protein [Verrucomicrobiae bacterium]|nr:transglutaminase family protein [Verrucomicrobiae bacterium]